MLEGDIWELGRRVSYKTSLKRCEKKPGGLPVKGCSV